MDGIREIEGFIDGVSKDVDRIKKQEILNSDVFEFNDFRVKEYRPEGGTYFFSIEQKFLKEVVRILKTSSNSLMDNIKITLLENRVKFSLFGQNIFSEIIIPSVSEIEDLDDFSVMGYPYIIFNLDCLSKIANEFGGVIDFEFIVETLLLKISSKRTNLEFSTDNEVFVDYHSKMKEINHLKVLDVDIFRDSIRYVSNFVKRDSPHKSLSVAENKNGMLCGGCSGSVGIYSSPIFEGFSLKIGYENLNPIYKILPYFNLNNTHIFESETYYIIRDENVYFGFDKRCYSFPSVDKFLKAKKAEEKIILERKELLRGLNRLAIVNSNAKIPLNINISGMGKDTKIEFFIIDKSGKTSKDSFNVFRDGSNSKDLSFLINMDVFLKVVSHFSSNTVCLKYIEGKALLVVEEGEKYKVITNISLLRGK